MVTEQELRREYNRRYYLANRKKELERSRQYRAANPTKVKATRLKSYQRHRDRRRKEMREYHAANKAAARERAKKWRAKNPDYDRNWKFKNKHRVRRLGKANRLWVRYGLTYKEYLALRKQQGGLCALCRHKRKLCVDHCHKSGVVRGLLCHPCNTALGLFRDCPKALIRAAKYVRKAAA